MVKGRIIYLLFALLLVLVIVRSEPVATYSSSLVTASLESMQKENDVLYQKIKEAANRTIEQPIEPRIDRIWKLIPGYNGIALDVEETYRVAKKSGKDSFIPIYKEIPTQKALWDFPPSPLYRANPKKKMVALMINVAWGNEYLPQILATLEKKQVKATFFLDGSWLKKNPDLANQIVAAGHEIGNHGTTHPMMSRLSKERIIEEIETTNKRIQEILQITPTLFAPPAGDYDQRVVELARERNMLTILWTLDTVDWRKPPYQEMVNRIIQNVDNGNLILMHPTEPTAKGLEAMITGIEKKGLQLGTVSEVISSNREGKVELMINF